MGLIAGVASWPEYRKNGMIRRLMLRGLEAMRDRGHIVSYLGPFHYPFYRKFGYEMMYEYRSYTLKISCMPDWSGKGRVRRIKPDPALLNRIYEPYAQRYNGMLLRDEFRWTSAVFKRRPGNIAVYYNEAGEPRGYIFYEIQGTEFKVPEMVALDTDARSGLWEFIRKHEGAYETVTFSAPADDSFPFLIDNPKGLATKCVTHLMARIVDVSRFLERYRFAGIGREELIIRLQIRDETAPWNEGTFELIIGEDGLACVQRLAETSDLSGADASVACSIQTLSTMLLGYKRPQFLYECGRLECDHEAVVLLERIVPRVTPYYIDFGY